MHEILCLFNFVISCFNLKVVTSQFREQVDLLKKISHPNLVEILGHCIERKHLILIHEIMARGSLADNLYSGRTYLQLTFCLHDDL